MNTGNSRISEDETSITVEPPLAKPVDNQDDDDDEGSVSEVVDSSLPAPGIGIILVSSIMALFYAGINSKKRYN
jgi:hypothetical protein